MGWCDRFDCWDNLKANPSLVEGFFIFICIYIHMNYIISEQQNNRIITQVLEYLDSNLTPYGGWDSPKDYKKALKSTGGEIFLFLEDTEGGEDKHMWYSTYENPNVHLEKQDSPIVLIPDGDYNSLTGYFGEYWKPVFIKWFKGNTKLPVKTVDDFGWTNS